jgi:solute:Na+ symporter, SSS family
MELSLLDWGVVLLFFLFSLLVGLWASKKAGQSAAEFFLSGRNMPWWLLGISMVATTFSADTPNLVTDIVRKNGVAGNWQWWAFLITGMFTVFIYARLWRKSGISTDLEFYEIRYSGKSAGFLRAFRALYLGVFFNVVIMASVLLAGIKMSSILLGFSPLQTVLLVGLITVGYASLGGLRGVLYTDFFQFILSMAGMVIAAIYIVKMPEIGGLEKLFSQPLVQEKQSLFPDFTNAEVFIPLFLIPLAVQWWAVWYPGAEPGGGGYIAQRMLSAKDEKNAVWATLLFNVAHYALRPWPWIIIALASLVVFPLSSDIAKAFPNLPASIVNDDLAFPAMLSYLPSGLLGLVIAALMAALMSTLSTHLNWGSSYIVFDFYKRFVRPQSSEKNLVRVGRWSTLLLMLLASALALALENALQAFKILLQIGAGTGLLFLLRWFWWRINATAEIVAMVVSFVIALYFEMIYTGAIPDHFKLLLGTGITTLCWVVAAFLGPKTHSQTLLAFYTLIRPYPWGWKKFLRTVAPNVAEERTEYGRNFSLGLILISLGCIAIYSLLFAIGFALYNLNLYALLFVSLGVLSSMLLIYLWKKYEYE